MKRGFIFVLFLQFLLFRNAIAKPPNVDTKELDTGDNDSTNDNSEEDHNNSNEDADDDDDDAVDDEEEDDDGEDDDNDDEDDDNDDEDDDNLTPNHNRVTFKSRHTPRRFQKSSDENDRDITVGSRFGNRFSGRSSRRFRYSYSPRSRSNYRSWPSRARYDNYRGYRRSYRPYLLRSSRDDSGTSYRRRYSNERDSRRRYDRRDSNERDSRGHYERRYSNERDSRGRHDRRDSNERDSRGRHDRYKDRRRDRYEDRRRGNRYDSDEDNDDSDDSRESRNRNRSSKRQQIRRSPVLMPSGQTRNITIPTDSKIWRCGKRSKLFNLDPNGKTGKIDYAIVEDEMSSCWSQKPFTSQIIKIEKIVSTCLWNRYKYRKRQVTDDAKVSNVRMLFFGAAAPTILELTQKGFDERNLTMQSTSWGAGFLLTEHSDQAHGYTTVQPDGSRLMLLCRVTLGTTQVSAAGSNLAHPPVGFQSVQGTVNAQSIYVLYRGEQVYPEYLITYK